ncbi:hypothetical protein QBC46DRAFT_368427 [Diplogelasinospora grovesii]|uniref:Uncharacterized protein n=1 Tax=Diplogelasinospora grovesii TaxID=303347 RepID=A0AAN6RY20_9PEZI|nr:hypothetical protein QBC46DRAFT_368427 [Diplogelasinospora grovesii]
MSSCSLASDALCGWQAGPDTRSTLGILWSSLSTIWLCTWTCLCLNIPEPGTRGWRFLLYKFRWQLFAILFPEVLVASAAEQWVSARQSVDTFDRLGYSEWWSIRHGFLADMGSFQLAYLVEHNHLAMPHLSPDDIRAVNKADGLGRAFTLVQVVWFCFACLDRACGRIGLTPLELETLTFILCTFHTFFFWYHKPLDPARQIVIPVNQTIGQLYTRSRNQPVMFEQTPLDSLRPPPDPKSLIMPFWFGSKIVFDMFRPATKRNSKEEHAGTISNSAITPPEGISWLLTSYLIVFQVVYYGLHIGIARIIPFTSRTEFYLWEVNLFPRSLGSHAAPWLARRLFRKQASTVLEVASMLPYWAKLLIHGPFVVGYIVARVLVLAVALSTLRALPPLLYQDGNWSNFLPHI